LLKLKKLGSRKSPSRSIRKQPAHKAHDKLVAVCDEGLMTTTILPS
jgi:hypothetical protein